MYMAGETYFVKDDFKTFSPRSMLINLVSPSYRTHTVHTVLVVCCILLSCYLTSSRYLPLGLFRLILPARGDTKHHYQIMVFHRDPNLPARGEGTGTYRCCGARVRRCRTNA